jgi:DNA-binding IclR family transcriptional regulator
MDGVLSTGSSPPVRPTRGSVALRVGGAGSTSSRVDREVNVRQGDSSSGDVPARRAVPAIEKAAIVLDVLATTEEALSFSQLAGRVPMARSSLHDVCSTLVRTGLAERSPEGRYTVGLKLVELSRHRLASMELVQAFQRITRAQGEPVETIVLAVLSGSDVVYVSFINGRRPLAVRYEIGMRLPAAFTASGKSMLATLPTAAVRELVGRRALNPNASGARKGIRELLTELDETRRRGFSIDDEETARGMACIGAPIFAAGRHQAVGAVAISLVKSASNWYEEANSGYVRSVAAAVTRELGGETASWRGSGPVSHR